MHILIILPAVALLTLSTSSCTHTPGTGAQDDRPALLVRHRLADPVLLPSPDPTAPDSDQVECPKVIRHDGQWWMFHTVIAREGSTVRKRIGLAISKDLVHWQKQGVVLDVGSAGAWDSGGISAPFPFRDADGTWYLFYDGFPADGYEQGRSAIGLARSSDLVHWSRVSDDPVLHPPDDEAAWDTQNLYQTFVRVGPDGRYWMYYNARNRYGAEQIGLAFSDDLLDWDRHPGNPILANGTREETQDNCIIGDPWVIEDGGQLYMFYFAYDCEHAREMLATSIDGIEWTKSPWNPIIDIGAPGTHDAGHAHKPCVIEHDGVWYHFYTAEGIVDGRNTRSIGLATSKRLPGVAYRN